MTKSKGVSRRDFLTSSGAALAASLTASQPGNAATSSKPAGKMNIILFMPDELRARSIGCYGNQIVQTPNMDRLAAEGVRFENCNVQYPVCGASRCSMMTGWPTHVHGHRSLYYFLRPHEPNMFRYLRQAGYDVFWYGKNDLLACDSFYSSVTEWGEPEGMGAPPNPWPLSDPHYYSFLYPEGGDPKEYADYHKIEKAISILERKPDKPFCIFLPLSSPHPPYSAPKGFHNMYDPDKLPPLRPVGLPRKPKFFNAIRKGYRLDQLGQDVFEKIHAIYLAKVSYTDWLLGELLAAVESTGHADDTTIFVISDHGDWAGDYGLVEKWPSGLDDDLTHVPLIVRVPGMAKGRVSEEIVELFDVMPTCLELAGTEAQHTHFARSLMPQLHGQPGDRNRAGFCEGGYNVYEPQSFEPDTYGPKNIYYQKVRVETDHPETILRSSMVKTREFKLILRPGGQSEFYDLRKDPNELKNVYGESSYANQQADLAAQLLNWYVLTSDTAPQDKDPRGLPPWYPTPSIPKDDWHRKLVDYKKD